MTMFAKSNDELQVDILERGDPFNLHVIEKVQVSIEELRQGRPILIVDDELEGEGDVCIPAQLATPEIINFMATHCRGIICQSITLEMSERLGLPIMVPNGGSPAFTITTDAASVGSGTSAFDRAITAQTIARSDTTGDDLVRPGHIFPIIACSGGVLERPGHTEASSDLARLAGFTPSAVICEVMAEDGHMIRPDALVEFAEKYNLKSITVNDLIVYRKQTEANYQVDTHTNGFHSRANTATSNNGKTILSHQTSQNGKQSLKKSALVEQHYYSQEKVKNVAILGCTGSVGRQTLDVIAALPEQFSAYALAAGSNVAELNQQIQRFCPELVSLSNGAFSEISNIDRSHLLQGEEGLIELATHPHVDVVVVATSGTVGLSATLAAIQAGKEVAIANKETLIIGGELVTSAAKENNVEIRPIDSEHSALWQCLVGEDRDHIEKLLLTASGGPFRTWSLEQIKQATPEKALQHPNWSMGQKITIDSATLMNKALEVIEAHWLFGQPYDRIQVLIHPQSIIHSMVEFIDDSVKAQLGVPDMRHAIQFALTYPNRSSSEFVKIDWTKTNKLTFEEPDLQRFPCLGLGYEAGRLGGTYPAVLVAADELLVDLFLKNKIGLLDIPAILSDVLEAHNSTNVTLESIHETMRWASNRAYSLAKSKFN